MPTVVALGTFDTKGSEYAYLAQRIRDSGADVLLVDAGVNEPVGVVPDIGNDEVAARAGADIRVLAERRDRGAAVATMSEGAIAVVMDLHAQGRLQAVIGLGGTGGSTLISAAMRALPIGVPKLLVSTVASGDTRPYVGAVDITMMYSVVDIAGVNQISATILANAAAAIAGMALAPRVEVTEPRPLVAASMFGVTTPCVTAARERLEELGYEVLVFHATGTGGASMEALVKAGFVEAVLDVTTTELADELVGGVFASGPERTTVAGRLGIPQVVSTGATDMVNFGPRDTVPERFVDRLFYEHNATTTLMRTTVDESKAIAHTLAERLNSSKAYTAVYIPTKGASMIAVEGGPFHDPAADQALNDTLRDELGPHIDVHVADTDINDAALAVQMADQLAEFHRDWSASAGRDRRGPIAR
jgi:uncharacterized protein (UPF0261 family)